MIIYYRISNNSYNKQKLANATKEKCLLNFVNKFGGRDNNKLFVIADNVTDKGLLKELTLYENLISLEHTRLSNAQSFKYTYLKACDLSDNELVYFVEDDYLHLSNADKVLKEGLERADYVSLYDHPDKYMDGINPYVENKGEVTRVILTSSCHWKLTNSTTMTFASSAKIIKEDKDIWMKHLTGSHPMDFDAFIELRSKGRTLITPIPSYSTHSEPMWLAPLIDWSKI